MRTRDPHTRKMILAAAEKVFGRKGYERTRVAEIIEAVGLAKGTFYLYFKSKQDIFLEIVKAYRDRLSGHLDSIEIQRISDRESFQKTFRKLSDSIFSIVEENRHATRLFFTEMETVDVRFAKIRKDTYRMIARIAISVFRRAQEAGIIRGDISCEIAGEAQVGMITHLIRNYLETPGKTSDPRRLAETMVQMNINGIYT